MKWIIQYNSPSPIWGYHSMNCWAKSLLFISLHLYLQFFVQTTTVHWFDTLSSYHYSWGLVHTWAILGLCGWEIVGWPHLFHRGTCTFFCATPIVFTAQTESRRQPHKSPGATWSAIKNELQPNQDMSTPEWTVIDIQSHGLPHDCGMLMCEQGLKLSCVV